MVGELDATGAVRQVGWASTQDHLTSIAGGHTGTGPAAVRLAKAVQVLLNEARGLDATELRKLTHQLLSIVDPDGDDRRAERDLDRLERAARPRRHPQSHPDPPGRTPPRDHGTRMLDALTEACRRLQSYTFDPPDH